MRVNIGKQPDKTREPGRFQPKDDATPRRSSARYRSTNKPEVAEGAWARSHISMTRARTVQAYRDNSASASAGNGSTFAIRLPRRVSCGCRSPARYRFRRNSNTHAAQCRRQLEVHMKRALQIAFNAMRP